MRYSGLSGPAWQPMANALLDVLAAMWWTFVAGLVVSGGCWYLGRSIYGEWVREHPPPRFRFGAERRLRRDFTRGLADLEEYVHEHDPAHVNTGPEDPGRPRTWRLPRLRRHGASLPRDRPTAT